MKYNIGIIGGGTSGAMTALGILIAEINLKKYTGDINITIIQDPNTPTIQVGESTSPYVCRVMHDVIDFNIVEDLKDVDGTLRFSTKYFWEKANNKNFYATYPDYGLHVNSESFSNWVFKKLQNKYASNFKEIKDRVSSIKQHNNKVELIAQNNTYIFDYVFDCRGSPTLEELSSDPYITPTFQAVNSVVIFPDFKKYDEQFTSSHITENGWMFGVPLIHRKAWGYLYNNTITNTEQAIEDFKKIINIDESLLRKITWHQYYRKEAIDNRVIFNGNRLYFFEPHHAIPLHYHLIIAKTFTRNLLTGINLDSLNEFYNDTINNIQDLIALNYTGDNNIDSPFWNITKKLAFKKLLSSSSFVNYCKFNADKEIPAMYWPHEGILVKRYLDGYSIDLNRFINCNV